LILIWKRLARTLVCRKAGLDWTVVVAAPGGLKELRRQLDDSAKGP